MREHQLARVSARLERFFRNQDSAAVLDPEAVSEADALLQSVTNPAADVEVARAVGWLYYLRYLLSDPDEKPRALAIALPLFVPVYQLRPDALPDDVRTYFERGGASSPGTPWILEALHISLLRRAIRTGDLAALDTAIELLRSDLDATPSDHPNRAPLLGNLSFALRVRFERTGSQVDVDEAVNVGRAAVGATGSEHPDAARYLSHLGTALLSRFGEFAAQADLDAAVGASQAAVEATPTDHPDRAGYLSNLGAALRTRFEQTGDMSDLDTAVEVGEAAVRATTADHPSRAGYLSNLGAALRTRFERSGAKPDLDAGIAATQAAVNTTPADHPQRAMFLSNLGLALRIQFEHTGDQNSLDAAIEVGRAAVDASPADHPQRAMYLSNLGLALRTRFERTGDQNDVDAAIEVGRAAVDASPADHPQRAMYLSNLGLALRTRFERTGVGSDLDAAIEASQAAVDDAPLGLPQRAAYLSNLGIALAARFERTGSRSDLDAAIEAARAAVDGTPADHPRASVYLSNLGLALRVRYERTGVRADIDAAVDVNTAAVRATPVDHLQHVGSLINLAGAVLVRFERTGLLADLDTAVDASTAAVNYSPEDHPSHAVMLTIQGVALRIRFERTGDQADLDAAVDASAAAVNITPSDHPYRAGRQHNLAVALRIQYERHGALADLDAAIEVGRAAVNGSPDDPNRAMYLSGLGYALHIRFERSRSSADLDAAIEAGREASRAEASSPRMRALGARGWARSAGAGGRWQEAVAGFEAASALLSRVVPRSLARADQEHLLVETAGLAADAAVCCVHAGSPEQAVELFEQGRAVLLGQALDIRTDVTALSEADPELARQFTELCKEFDRVDEATMFATPSWHEPGHTTILDPTGSIHARERRERATANFDQVITRIRALSGFEGFLQPPAAVELQSAASDGPVAIVAVSVLGSHALILTREGVDHVPLPGLTPQNVFHQVIEFLNALSGAGAATERKVEEILGWLWDALAEPVLDRLEIHGPPEDGSTWPRMWWCLSGLLSFLPVHAAGYHHTRFDPAPSTLIDRVLSSYTPTIRALTHARRVPSATTASTRSPVNGNDPRVLAVAMPHTPSARALPGARDEAEGLQRRFGERVCILLEGEATREAVLASLPQTRWAHFACHGAAEINDPSNSRLLLHDQPLTVLDVARLQLNDTELAFLSACETARPGGQLTDEAIHLASAFQLAGYQHVIATLWPISDYYAVKLAEHIYNELADSGDVTSAVHTATRTLRNYAARYPSVWASHVHAGGMNPTTVDTPTTECRENRSPMGSDDEVAEAARVIRPYLADLLGPQDASILDQRLAEQITNDAEPSQRACELRAILEENSLTRQFLVDVLAHPYLHPPYIQDHFRRRPLGDALPIGEASPVLADRYICPDPSHDVIWYRPDIGTPIPRCSTHDLMLVRS